MSQCWKGRKRTTKCKYCNHTFWGGAPRIREHFLGTNAAALGVKKCAAKQEECPEIEDVIAGLQEVQHDLDEKRERATKKRALDRSTASISAASAGQRQTTMGECRRAVSKAEVDAAYARFVYASGSTFASPRISTNPN